MSKRVTAEEFNKKPQQVYLEAYEGKEVVINHGRFPKKVFVLSCRDRKPLESNCVK